MIQGCKLKGNLNRLNFLSYWYQRMKKMKMNLMNNIYTQSKLNHVHNIVNDRYDSLQQRGEK